MNNCNFCNALTDNPKFCSHSCSAKFHNRGIRRHSSPKAICQKCGNTCSKAKSKFCSRKCRYLDSAPKPPPKLKKELLSNDHHKLMNALRQSRYRAKKYRVLSENADSSKIKEIYKNCPQGYEVDHIIPLSLGGLHHEDNLQYLPWRENRSKSNRYSG